MQIRNQAYKSSELCALSAKQTRKLPTNANTISTLSPFISQLPIIFIIFITNFQTALSINIIPSTSMDYIDIREHTENLRTWSFFIRFFCYFYFEYLLGLVLRLLLVVFFLHHYQGAFSWWQLQFLIFESLLLLQEVRNAAFLLLFELLFLFLLTDVSLEVVELLLHGPLTFLIIQHGLRYRFNWCIANGNKHRFFYNLVGLALLLLVIGFNHFVFKFLLVLVDTNIVLHHLLLGFQQIFTFLVATGIIQVEEGAPHKSFRDLLVGHDLQLQKQGSLSPKSDTNVQVILLSIQLYLMNTMKDCIVFDSLSHVDNNQNDQGFSDEEKEPVIVVSQPEVIYTNTSTSAHILDKKKTTARIQEPRAKLRYFFNEQPSRSNMHNIIANREFVNRSSVSKSFQFRKKQVEKAPTIEPVIKSKRTLIGENMTILSYAIQDFKQIKQLKTSEGSTIAFEAAQQINTHGYLKKVSSPFDSRSFINHKYNLLLKQKLKDSFIVPKRNSQQDERDRKIKFNSQLESGNLELVVQISQSEYELYLRIDTNTHGHQNWFLFQVSLPETEANSTFTFHICNMKRDFKMIEKGQRIFIRQFKDEKWSRWQLSGTNISITDNTNPKLFPGKTYKLSFKTILKPNSKYQLSLLPSYTYSDMLNFLQQIEQKHKKYIDIDILGYTLAGLALPVVTITNKDFKNQGKTVVLVSGRVHPGETVGSFMVEGIVRKLLDQISKPIGELLKNTIFKIVPMLNPDGVVFGNFRTNYLGIDLNRSFDAEDEVLYPEIVSIKNLGRDLKSQYGSNFSIFLDLHGHSSQKNIFTYGPNFQSSDPKFYIARLLPKIIQKKSKYFKYSSCSFRLEQHKLNTARGFFLTDLNVMTYTVQSSYSMYDDLEGVQRMMGVQDWIGFGMDLVESLQTMFRIKSANSIRSNRDLRDVLQANQKEEIAMMKKIRSQIRKEMKSRPKYYEKQEKQEDSDCESESQDLTEQQRKNTQKSLIQFSIPSFSLPKVLKPIILFPTVTPRLFDIGPQKDESNVRILYTKRSKYNTLRMMNANSIYATYLKNLESLEKLKPIARNIKLERKIDF